MTDSRETMRRRAFRDQAPSADPSPLAVALTELCIIHGCLSLREGNNLCQQHQQATDPGRASTT